jgi:hypothetical protein
MPTETVGNNTGNTYSGTDDTQVAQINPTTNYANGTTYFVAKYDVGDPRWNVGWNLENGM